MNIFVTDPDPVAQSKVLPDKHIVKMPDECCQMLSIVASDKWGHGFGTLPKADGNPYATEKGAFRNHPCTKWANDYVLNWRWLIRHGLVCVKSIRIDTKRSIPVLLHYHMQTKFFPFGDPTGRSGKDPKPFVRRYAR